MDDEVTRLAATADDAIDAVLPSAVRAVLDDVVVALMADLGESPEAVRGAALSAGAIIRMHTLGIEVQGSEISRADLMTVALCYRIVRHPLSMQVLSR